mmetsp:Transcript_23161/g.42975  ORF Transcript_23161/g.42975 Transcript_23161/m.42975 type:complete len:271 (+) Transcript_23161:1773-2585(+)
MFHLPVLSLQLLEGISQCCLYPSSDQMHLLWASRFSDEHGNFLDTTRGFSIPPPSVYNFSSSANGSHCQEGTQPTDFDSPKIRPMTLGDGIYLKSNDTQELGGISKRCYGGLSHTSLCRSRGYQRHCCRQYLHKTPHVKNASMISETLLPSRLGATSYRQIPHPLILRRCKDAVPSFGACSKCGHPFLLCDEGPRRECGLRDQELGPKLFQELINLGIFAPGGSEDLLEPTTNHQNLSQSQESPESAQLLACLVSEYGSSRSVAQVRVRN